MNEHVDTCDKPIANCWACSDYFGLVPGKDNDDE